MANKYATFGKEFTKNLGEYNYCEVSVKHRKAGFNYFNGNYEEAGVEVCVTPVTRKVENGIVSTSFMVFQSPGFRVLVDPMTRFNQKKFDAIVEQTKAILDKVTHFMEEGLTAVAAQFIMQNVGSAKKKVA